MNIKKISLLLLLMIGKLSYAPKIPNFSELSERERIKILGGFIASYLVFNIEALKSYDKTTNKYTASNAGYALIVLASLMLAIQREYKENIGTAHGAEGESDSHQAKSRAPDESELKKHWSLKDLRTLTKNAFCTTIGALLGYVVPPLVQWPFFIRKCGQLLS